MKGRKMRQRYAGILAFVIFILTFLPYLSFEGRAYGAVVFGGGELCYDEELVALWDQLAEQEGVDLERTDFIGHMTPTYPHPGIAIYKQQTSVSPSGKWKDYEYRNMYCISHSRELAENPNTTMETTAVWYIKKEPYTLQNLPPFVVKNTGDEYCRRLNFLLMAYGANYEAYQGTVNSDPVIKTANYYLCQSFCTLSERARFTGDYVHDWEIYRQSASQIAERYNPSELGSTQVYQDMMRDMEKTFRTVWSTAKLAADCVESQDTGYVFRPTIALGEDGMYHASYPLTPDTREFFTAASILPYGDWSYEITEDKIDFRSQSGQLPEGGAVAEINLENANGIIRRSIGKESVRELHMPVKLGNRWSLTFAQGNLISNLKEGLKIYVGGPSGEETPQEPGLGSSSVTRYKHTEKWQADYVVNLRKLDAETGKPLEGAWFDILEAFDDSQLEGSVLEDDNWDNDKGSQFLRWSGWDNPYEENGDPDPCDKDQEVTDEDGWLVEAASFGAGELQPTDVRAHRDIKYYSYTKGYCSGHPEPDPDDEEEVEEYERQIEICEGLVAAGGFYHSLDSGAEEWLRQDRDRHYEAFVSLTYDYSARELAARNGYIVHNQDRIHEPFENIFDGIHGDTVPVETVTVHSSQYYALAEGLKTEKSETERMGGEEASTAGVFLMEGFSQDGGKENLKENTGTQRLTEKDETERLEDAKGEKSEKEKTDGEEEIEGGREKGKEEETKAVKVEKGEKGKADETEAVKEEEGEKGKADETEAIKEEEGGKGKADETEAIKEEEREKGKADEAEAVKTEEDEKRKADETEAAKKEKGEKGKADEAEAIRKEEDKKEKPEEPRLSLNIKTASAANAEAGKRSQEELEKQEGEKAGKDFGETEENERETSSETEALSIASKSNAAWPIKTEVLPGEKVDLDDIWIVDEDEEWDRRPILPGATRMKEQADGRRKKDKDYLSVRSQISFHPSPIARIAPSDPDYAGSSGTDWTFEVYDHRTEGEVHINKRDLLLKQGESEEYDSYGDTQGDGTLEGAVYGLFAASDLIHPDGKTGVVFEKGNLVAVAATDKNGDASFMAITEAPGTLYDYNQGRTTKTGFAGPENKYTKLIHQYTSNPDYKGSDRWYYPITDNQSVNGNCWIGRPLLLGTYYIQELTRSEGYELSVYGVEAEISNRSSWEGGGSPEAKGKASVEKVEGNVRVMEDTEREETVTEITISGEGTDYGCEISIKNIDPLSQPSFWLTETGRREEYRQWTEPEVYYEPVEAPYGTQVIIGGKSVEAKEGEQILLPNGEKVWVNHTKELPVSPEKRFLTGEKGAIPTFNIQYIPELTGIEAWEPEKFADRCNEAFSAIGMEPAGQDAPYFLIELGKDPRQWPQKIYDFFENENRPAFNGAFLERIINQNGDDYAVLRYSFLENGQARSVVYSALDETFYVRYAMSFWDGTEGYLYRGYPLSSLSEEDYDMGNRLCRWVSIPNEGPEREKVGLYEELETLPWVSRQEYKSYWVYGEGEYLRDNDGSIYQKEQVRDREREGYQTVETVSYDRLEAEYENLSDTWKIFLPGSQPWREGKLLVTVRYGNRFAGQGKNLSVTAAPSMNLTGTYVRPVTLAYPGQDSVYEDAGTRKVPTEVWERAIVQRVQVEKDIEKSSYHNTNSYGKVHKDWFTWLFGGYQENGQEKEAAERMDNFRFKIYLKSNLARLYRAEDGTVVWQDRQGREMDEAGVLAHNRAFPERVRKIYTKVPHQTQPLYADSRDAVIANEILYEYSRGQIEETAQKGYTAILETRERLVEDGDKTRTIKSYNYEKFFDALDVANTDKWDDASPTYTSWQPIGNQSNRSRETIENARVSDQVRQFAIDWYLEDEVEKLVKPVRENKDEKEAKEEEVSYPDEIHDRALREAIIKAENYLIPFFAYDLDEIYGIEWDERIKEGDKDPTTLSADMLEEREGEKSIYCGISAYLPYGTYVVVEQQPKYAGTEYEKNYGDFKNKHYQIDKPKEVVLPSVYAGAQGAYVSPEVKNDYYIYDKNREIWETEQRYKIRWGQEDHRIYAHNHHGDFEIYKYGMDVDLIDNGVPERIGEGDYFALTQEMYKPYKNYYNSQDDRLGAPVDFYLTEGQSGRKGIAGQYRYSSVAEHRGMRDDVLYFGGISTEDNVPGIFYQDQVPVMQGMQISYDSQYAPMLVPWSVTAPDRVGSSFSQGGRDRDTGESDYTGFGCVKFRNRFYTARLRLEKLDSETHENILHDNAVFAIYGAKREALEGGTGNVCFYEKDTTIAGTRGFLESMGAVDIRPMARNRSLLDRLLGKNKGPGNLYTGVVPAGTPMCEESEKIVLGDGQGQQTVAFSSYSTVLDGQMKAETKEDEMAWQLQTVGYLETPQPLGAGAYVICEEKAPSGYVRTRPMALEVYSDKVTYYKEGDKDSRVLAAIYQVDSEEQTTNKNKPQDTIKLARVNVENVPIKLTVEKLKESSTETANTTLDKTVTYKVSGRIDGSLVDIGGDPEYEYAYDNGRYLGYAWRKGTLEYLRARKAAGESVEIAYEGSVFAGYGYVTRKLETAKDTNPYVAGARMALFDAIVLNPSGDTQDHAYKGLEIRRNSTNNVVRMYIKQGYAGEKTDFVKERDENGKELVTEIQTGVDRYGNPIIQTGNIWAAVTLKRPDTDILYYDLDSLEVMVTEDIDESRITYGYDRNHNKVPVAQVESDKANFDRTDTEHSLFAFKGGIPFLEFVGGDFTKLAYVSGDKRLKVDDETLVYHLDREGNRDSLVDPYTGMAYVLVPGDREGRVMVWAVNVRYDEYGNVIARDKITTSRVATIGENQEGYREEEILAVTNHSGHGIPENDCPSYAHEESGSIIGTWRAEKGEESHRETTVPTNSQGQNLNGEVLVDDNNGSFSGEQNPVYDSYGLPQYYQKSESTYDKGTELYDRNGDFVRYQDSDNLEEYNNNAYHIHSHEQLYDGQETKEQQDQKQLFHRQGEGYILENSWITSDRTINDPFDTEETDGQPDILKRVPAGNYIMEELESPKGYLKGMPTGIAVREIPDMQHTFMVDQTIKVEIPKIDEYTCEPVAGARLALFKAKKVYSAKAPKGYYLEKTETKPTVYETTDSRAGDRQWAKACWDTGKAPVYEEGIPAGTYLLEELITPSGFVTCEPVEVEIANTKEVQIFPVYNDHTKVEVEKYTMDGDDKKPLYGAGFTLFPAVKNSEGEVVFCEGQPEYDSVCGIDSWITEDPDIYSGFIPAFEAMYKDFGTEEGTVVCWGQGENEHKAEYVSSLSLDDSLDGGESSLHPTSAVLMFQMENESYIRIRVSKETSFEYQFDYRKLWEVNEYACSYMTLDGVRRLDYLPTGEAYVLVETQVPKGYAKAKDQVIQVKDTKDVQRYVVENTEGKLYVSKESENRAGELEGAVLELYRAGKDGSFLADEEHLEAVWTTGKDGVYTEEDFVRGRILPGYKIGDRKPHEIGTLDDGIYWLREKKSPGYYTLAEPVRIEYRQEEEIRLVRVCDRPVTGSLQVVKEDLDGNPLTGAVFELAAYRKQDRKNPVWTRQISDTRGVIQADNLSVGEIQEDGQMVPYLYKLKEIIPPEGYEVNTQIFTWEFDPDKDGESYGFGETAKKQFTVADRKTKVSIGKKDFEEMENKERGFLAGALLAMYEIIGRDERDQILYDENQPYDQWMTTSEEEHEIEGLTAGKSYLLRELSAPPGYDLMDPVIITMSADGRRIAGISNRLNTITVYSHFSESTREDSIQAVTVKGRYPVRTEYELTDAKGNRMAYWVGNRDGYTLRREDGWKDNPICTVTERTLYSDGGLAVTGRRTEVMDFGEDGSFFIPGREAKRTMLQLKKADGTEIGSFYANEVIGEKTIYNNISLENPVITLKNSNNQAGTALNPAQAVCGVVEAINDSNQKADMEILVDLDSATKILDAGGGSVEKNQIRYQIKDVLPMESRTVSYEAEIDEKALAIHMTAAVSCQGRTIETKKTVPVLQKNKLTLYNELTGSGKEAFEKEESRFRIRLYDSHGEELKGRYFYEGSHRGFLRSGEEISLAGNEYVTIDPGIYRRIQYQITREEDGKEVREQNTSGEVTAAGACGAYSRLAVDPSQRVFFRKGESYLLTETTLFSDKSQWESSRMMFTIDEKAAVGGVIAGDRKTRIRLSKADITGDKELAGCQMSVRDKDGREVAAWISGEEPYTLEGVLIPGESYCLREVRPRDGFAWAEEIWFTVSAGGILEQVTMKDEDTKVLVQKISGEPGGQPVLGAILQILNEDGTPAVAVSDREPFEKGEELIFESGADPVEIRQQLCAGQKYLLHEVKPAPGYAYGEDVEFTVSQRGETDRVVMVDPPTRVSFSKTDITGEKELPGNRLRVKTLDGKEVVSWTSTEVPYELTGILNAGETYILEETQPCDGFAWAEEIRFTVSLDGSVDLVSMKNDRTRVEILKTDADSGEPLPGAVLQIRNVRGDILEQWTSETEGHWITGKLAAGESYFLCEIEAPAGYQIADPVEFQMPKKAEILKLVFENKKKRGDKGKPGKPDTPKTDKPKEPGRITAWYDGGVPLAAQEFSGNVPKGFFGLAATGDSFCPWIYRILLIVSFLGACTAFFAIQVTKRGRSAIIGGTKEENTCTKKGRENDHEENGNRYIGPCGRGKDHAVRADFVSDREDPEDGKGRFR